MLSSTRREARERALELLYEAEAKSLAPADVITQLIIRPDEYSVVLAEGVGAHAEKVDEIIGRLAKGWTVARMPWVDRNVLRMGTFELFERPDVPTAVVLSEAVELAKRFSGPEASKFVNGVLAAIAREVRPASPVRGG